MPLKFENLAVKLSAKEVEEILVKHFRQEGYQASDISIQVGTEPQGFGAGERDVTVFKHISVTLKPKRAERRDEGFERM